MSEAFRKAWAEREEIVRELKPRTFQFRFPLPPNRSQDTSNGRARSAAKKKYYKQLDELQQANLLPAPPRLPLMRAVITGSVHAKNISDDDNIMARMKWPQDWLKSRGYIVEDKRPFLTWLNIPEQTIDRQREPVVILTLAELTEAA